jgi:prevent-host-death family protein
MNTASIGQLKAQPSAVLKQTGAGPVVVTRNGKPVAVLVGVDDEEALERMVFAHLPRLRSILDAANARIEAGQGIPHEEFWRRAEARNPAKPRKGDDKRDRSN